MMVKKIINSKIISCGSFLPENILTNTDLEKTVDTTDAWIFERTGIKQRHIADKKHLTSDISYFAALEAIKKSGLKASDIDMIIVATTTPDLTFPATATIVQSKLGIKNGFAFDVQAVCSGFIYALNIADNFIKVGQVKNVLVIGADILSRIVDWKDRNTCVLFGDGAGAVVVSATDEQNTGILASELHSDGDYCNILNTTGGTSSTGNSGFITMMGKEVFKHAVEKMSKCVIDVLKKVDLDVKDIDLLIPHQANSRILLAVAKKIGLEEEKVIITLASQANTSAATIPLALDYAMQNGRIKKGDIVVMEALGGGLTWGGIVIRW
jgi:3-oxoacyl-[acyl-carrier-protein] synthase-3